MATQYRCGSEMRRRAVAAHETLNGIDYLEVLDTGEPDPELRQRTLLVWCLKPVPTGLRREHVQIRGGVRVTPIRVQWAHPAQSVPEALAEEAFLAAIPEPERERVLVVRTECRGDFSTYSLTLVSDPNAPDLPDNFDPQLREVEFSFKVECPSEFDCKPVTVCPAERLPQPQIDYLARDYASFRRLILDRLAVTVPNWKERNPADVGIVMAELLAYVGDHLSYHQDAVATEAYLDTARRRPSIRRHSRLLDYPMHDGCNARTWVCLEVSEDLTGSDDGPVLPKSTPLLTRLEGRPVVLDPNRRQEWLAASPEVFETLHDVPQLRARRNLIQFYAWGDARCCLPKGATRATLLGSATDLELKKGDVLIFEEVAGPDSGLREDADPAHRHAVRLNSVPQDAEDPLNLRQVLEITWHAEDALPFPLCLWQLDDGSEHPSHVSVARGNVVLADHGLTFEDEALIPGVVPEEGRYSPQLPRGGVTQRSPYDDEFERTRPAAEAIAHDARKALPAVGLHGSGESWTAQRDMLSSDRFSPEFVVEMENDGRAFLRFGAKTPASGLTATYSVGNGRAGNVGAEAIAHVVTAQGAITGVHNPLPASGGTDPEPIEDVRLYAPQAFRRQERAVTAEDYREVTERHAEVQKAAATLRWTGSWHTMFVTVDRRGGQPVNQQFRDEVRRFLERFRLAGHDIEIDGPRFVPLDIVFTVCVKPGYLRSDVKAALLETFSNVDLPDGRRGFFHPDNFTFGQSVFLSPLIAAAMQVPGVDWVDIDERAERPNRFGRWGGPSCVAEGRIDFDRLEIARLDNDPSFPENGKNDFLMEGGL